jgi:DNA-binding NarL/FixJ family response regulator
MPTANALEVVPRILISDAYEVVRRGLLRILQTRANLEVVAVARDGGDAIRMAVETKPDIVVIGYALPMINGVEVTRQIRARLPGTEILIFTNQEDVAVIDQLLRAGARGYVLKSDGNVQLIASI